MFAFGKSFFRASRFNRIVCHFNVFANVFCPFNIHIDIFRNAGCFQGFKRGAYRQLRVKEVSCDMKAVLRDSRDFFGYIPYDIALPVVRVYGDFIFGYNIGAGFIRFDFVASDKNARQSKCHCKNGKNTNDLFFVGFHNKPRKIYCGALKISKKYNKCIPADFCDKPTCHKNKSYVTQKDAHVTNVIVLLFL